LTAAMNRRAAEPEGTWRTLKTYRVEA